MNADQMVANRERSFGMGPLPIERSQRPRFQCVPLKGGGIIIRSASSGTTR